MPRSLSNPTHGDDLNYLQTALNALPSAQPALAVDGDFGPLTENRVREYQTSEGLVVDGLVGPQTWGRKPGAACWDAASLKRRGFSCWAATCTTAKARKCCCAASTR